MTNRMFRAACSAAVLGMLTVSEAAFAQDQTKKSAKGGADQKFATEAAQGGMAEVQMGQLAKDKASSDAVKQFGQRMIDDHTKANDQFKSIASQEGITLPADIGPKHQAAYDRLSKLSGTAFDQAYMKHMVMDHKEDVADFKKEAASGHNAAIKKFASDTLPTLQSHLQMAQDTASKAGASAGHSMDHSSK